jgi:cyclic-di-GMP-binding protein
MPSFDIVSEVNLHELTNAVDQTNREVGTRFDFKGSDAQAELTDSAVVLHAENEFQVEQMRTILYTKIAKRGLDVGCLEDEKPEVTGSRTRQRIVVRQGIDKDLARKIVKLVKESKLKVQASAQGEQVRVTGKKRDDLQQVIALLREADLGLPLQFTNFRD